METKLKIEQLQTIVFRKVVATLGVALMGSYD